MKAIKDQMTSVRLPPKTYEAMKLVAALTHRSVSGLVEHSITLYILKNYPDAFNENAKLKLDLGEAA